MSIAPRVERRRHSATLRVLVADDERDTVDAMVLILKNEGHVVHSAYTGKEVLSAISVFRPDVVILDIGLPGVSGYAIARAIRNSLSQETKPG